MDRRHFLKLVGSVGAVVALPIRWIREPRQFVIAASNASPGTKAQADVVCNGHNDAATIQRTVDQLGSNDSIMMNGGTFYLNQSIDFRKAHSVTITGCHLIGTGNPIITIR
jgi:hypothetical protein